MWAERYYDKWQQSKSSGEEPLFQAHETVWSKDVIMKFFEAKDQLFATLGTKSILQVTSTFQNSSEN